MGTSRFVINRNAEKIIKARIERKLGRVGEFVRTAAVLNAPWISGALRDSIFWKVFVVTGKMFVWIGTKIIYGPIIEKGSGEGSKMGKRKAQPYLYPALFDNKAAIRYIFRKG